MTSPTPDFNKNAFTLTPTQLGEWVFNEIQKRSSLSLHEQKLRYDHIRFLMAVGADPAWNDSMRTDGMDSTHKGVSLAMAAAYSCDVEALKILADFNVNLDTRDSFGLSPLLYTLRCAEDPNAYKQVTEAALYLIGKNVDVKTDAPIITASAAGLIEVVEALIQAKADVNAENSWDETALAAAVLKQKLDVVKILLKAGADANWVSSKSGKPLVQLANEQASKSADATEIAQALNSLNNLQKLNDRKPKGPIL
jgi:ankyrin repeat protein